MCGRFTQTAPYPQLADRFGLPRNGPKLKPRYNIAPSQDVPVIVTAPGERAPRLEVMTWGLIPHWAKEAAIGHKMINARAETLREKPAYRGLVQSRRCLVPASGFYEWAPATKGRSKVPMYFTSPKGVPLALAGLWDEWKDPRGAVVHSFTIITREANDLIRPTHDRMPVILRRENEAAWVAGGEVSNETVEESFKAYPQEGLTGYAVGAKVNSPANDSEECIQRIEKGES